MKLILTSEYYLTRIPLQYTVLGFLSWATLIQNLDTIVSM